MITIVTCDECKGQKSLPFFLSWRYNTKRCEYCDNEEEEIKQYNFCSDKCLRKFANKFYNHKHDWTLYSGCVKLGKDNTPEEGYMYCKICHLTEMQKLNKKDKKKWRKIYPPFKVVAK